MNEVLSIIAKPFSNGLRPIPNLTVSEWSNQYRFLSSTSSSEAGRYSVDRTPYLREIMDRLGKTDDCQEIVFMKGSQIGATESALNFIGYSIHMNPSIILLVMPTDEAIKKNSRTRINPMLKATPILRDKIKEVGTKDAENTINSKSFLGGVLMMIGANSPVGLSSTPAAKILLDEVDRFPLSAGSEGSPVDLARARARTFANRKIFLISTPTNEGESVIAKEFEDGDKRYYNVHCIHCKEKFVITFDCLTWDQVNPETVRCACPECGGLHEERHKTVMLGNGEWVPTAKSSNPRKHSYHLSALYSPAGFYSWEELIRDYVKTKGDSNKEKTFVNTVLGETYKIKGESPDFENLYNRREEYELGTVPEGVYLLTMGVDIQKDRIELEVVGWGVGLESWSVDYKVLVGDTAKQEVWQELREVINSHYICEDGTLMSINMTCVDAGYNTKTVYDFTSTFGYNRVKPIMGRDSVKDVMVSPPKQINISKSGKKITGAKVWGLGVSLLKSELYGFLKLQATEIDGIEIFPKGYCHFPQYDRNYFKMLTAEELQLSKNKKGYDVWQWTKKYERNEALDVRNYARAAAYIIGVDRFRKENWDRIKMQKVQLETTAEIVIEKPKPKKSSFWGK